MPIVAPHSQTARNRACISLGVALTVSFAGFLNLAIHHLTESYTDCTVVFPESEGGV